MALVKRKPKHMKAIKSKSLIQRIRITETDIGEIIKLNLLILKVIRRTQEELKKQNFYLDDHLAYDLTKDTCIGYLLRRKRFRLEGGLIDRN